MFQASIKRENKDVRNQQSKFIAHEAELEDVA